MHAYIRYICIEKKRIQNKRMERREKCGGMDRGRERYHASFIDNNFLPIVNVGILTIMFFQVEHAMCSSKGIGELQMFWISNWPCKMLYYTTQHRQHVLYILYSTFNTCPGVCTKWLWMTGLKKDSMWLTLLRAGVFSKVLQKGTKWVVCNNNYNVWHKVTTY